MSMFDERYTSCARIYTMHLYMCSVRHIYTVHVVPLLYTQIQPPHHAENTQYHNLVNDLVHRCQLQVYYMAMECLVCMQRLYTLPTLCCTERQVHW